MTLHLIKLCVGVENIADLQRSIDRRIASGKGGAHDYIHATRMMPKRAEEILDGGSLYWVIKGSIQVRQRILELRSLSGADGLKRCGIVLEPLLHPVRPVPRRVFQGWRYLLADDAPPDLSGDQAEDVPAELMAQLVSLGLA
ncbi:lysophospholipase [Notoacmeibacter marinus]|uniref:Lysophospholipase n=1 Tax=Notoacmeibacter marinus TaxID=1876515 RepID=A0A231UW20_9HYPH|nr:DUF1489 domain-containing protein [Notoacmeibacter marinus]OXT00159.1 lysophospholipase [Notoacmeibacter marinus]